MSKAELLQQYKNDVNNLRKCAKAINFTDKEIDQIFKQCFQELKDENLSSDQNESKETQKYLFTTIKIFFILLALFISIYILLTVHQPTSSLVLRNVQGLIYTGFKTLRYLSVPVIKFFPFLTDFYDETCLVENPYFFVSGMDCWPCENIHSVIDLSGLENDNLYRSEAPYMIKTQQKEVLFETLKQLYYKNKTIFDTQANSIKSTNSSIDNLEQLFHLGVDSSTHVSWRINKMLPARLLRNLFPRPSIISEWSGQSIERYVMIDGPNASTYILPNSECSYVIVAQATGQRTIILKPPRECVDSCKTISVVLKPSYILWYNWWYWRPISLPIENSNETSITYLTSYC